MRDPQEQAQQDGIPLEQTEHTPLVLQANAVVVHIPGADAAHADEANQHRWAGEHRRRAQTEFVAGTICCLLLLGGAGVGIWQWVKFDKWKEAQRILALIPSPSPTSSPSATPLSLSVSPSPSATPDPVLVGLLNFLKANVTIPDENQDGKLIPISYDATPEFWERVCATEPCVPLSADPNSPSFQLQTERILSTVGSDIYDAGVWQIVMALTGNMDFAYNQEHFLNTGRTADANPLSTIRATTDGNIFRYNNQSITLKDRAYIFRMLGPAFVNPDPLAGRLAGIPDSATQTWVDWKPISGENAWANYIAPLQMLYAKYNQNAAAIPLSEMERSHGVFTAVSAMQANIGGIYYTTSGVAPNQGSGEVNPYSISVENTVSMLSGLSMYRAVLMAKGPTEKFADGVTVERELQTVQNVMVAITNFLKDYANNPAYCNPV